MRLPQSKDSEPLWRRMIIAGRWVTVGMMIGAMMFPLASEAWFFSVAQAQSDQPTSVAPTPSNDNAQTVDLLVPSVAMTSDGSAVDTDADVTIDSGTALSPEIGSDGTLADVTGASDSDSGAIQTYVVVSGDTVAKVAALFGVSQDTIRSANNMSKSDVLHVGDLLLILPVSGIRYTVKSGDSIPTLEKKFKLSDDDAQSFLDDNDLSSTDGLTIGQVLIIPGIESSAVASSSKSTSPAKASKFVFKGSTAEMGSTALMIHVPIVSTIVRNYFIKPIPCPMTQGKHDLYAVDLSCGVIGTPIKAAADGIVMYAKYGNNGGYGNLIIMKHPNGMLTFYAHIKDGGFNVKQGQSVTQGTVIAYVGDTGESTGPHLHFEVRGGGNPGFDYSGAAWKK